MPDPGSYALTSPQARQRTLKAASVRSATLLAADVTGFVLAACIAFIIHMALDGSPFARAYEHMTHQGLTWHGWGTLLVFAVLLAYFGSRGHYTSRVPFWSELSGIVTGLAAALLCDAMIRMSVYDVPFAQEAPVRWLVFLPCMLLGRQAARAGLEACGLWRLRTVIIGEGRSAVSARAALMSEPGLGYQVVGTMDLDRAARMEKGSPSSRGLLAEFDAEFAVVAASADHPGQEGKVVAALAREQVPFALAPVLDGLPVTGVTSQYFLSHDIMLLVCGNNLARPVSRVVKSLFDQAVAAMLLLLLAPLFVVLCALIRADGGPAFFGHVRIGENGRRFSCLKFRTMVVDSGAVLARLLAEDPVARIEWAATQKLRHDPRITRLGHVLRKTSLDELPQLLNVLRGQMSLVGPRPIVDDEVARYGDDISYYYEAKPGITGLWQVSGRSDTSYEHRVQLDVWYVRNWSLWHDIAILLKTVPAVVLKQGAV